MRNDAEGQSRRLWALQFASLMCACALAAMTWSPALSAAAVTPVLLVGLFTGLVYSLLLVWVEHVRTENERGATALRIMAWLTVPLPLVFMLWDVQLAVVFAVSMWSTAAALTAPDAPPELYQNAYPGPYRQQVFEQLLLVSLGLIALLYLWTRGAGYWLIQGLAAGLLVGTCLRLIWRARIEGALNPKTMRWLQGTLAMLTLTAIVLAIWKDFDASVAPGLVGALAGLGVVARPTNDEAAEE